MSRLKKFNLKKINPTKLIGLLLKLSIGFTFLMLLMAMIANLSKDTAALDFWAVIAFWSFLAVTIIYTLDYLLDRFRKPQAPAEVEGNTNIVAETRIAGENVKSDINRT